MKKSYIIIFLVIILINFFLPRLMPGDPFLYLSVEDGNVSVTFSEEQIEKYKAYYGLDKPLYIQFIDYLKGLLRGDLGYSIYFNIKVVEIINARISWTVAVVLTSLILSSFLGTVIGAISAWFREKYADKFIYFFMVTFSEIPPFLVGIFFLFILGAKYKIFPISGGVTAFATYDTSFEYMMDIIHHAVLPILTLTLSRIGSFYLLSRNTMISVLSKNYITTAQAKGLTKIRIIFHHAVRNSLPPIVARFFMSLGTMFGGAVIIENIFAYPGIGSLMREAVLVRDYVLVQGIFLSVAITVLSMNFIAEIIYKKLDPRVR